MNVTLVYPCIRNFGGFNTLGKHVESCFILHGLSSLSACLKQEGFTVNMLDLRERLNWADTADWIRRDKSEVYGIYMSTMDYHETLRVAEIIKKVKPASKIVVGGPHPSITPGSLENLSVFDYVVSGEGEITFPKMLRDLNAYPRMVKGEHPDLNALPFEDREVFNLEKAFSVRHPAYPSPFVNVISGRGCPHNCSFCKPGEDMIFGRFRMRSVDHLMGEIRMVKARYPQVRLILVDDDLFTVSRKYLEEFIGAYDVDLPFSIQTRADWAALNFDLLRRLKEVGLIQVRMGLESGNQRILNFMRKGTTVEQNYMAVRNCHALGLTVIANYMLGLPTETKAEVLDTLRMIRETKPEYKSAAFFTPVVGTDLYDYCKEHGLLISEDPAVLGTRSISENRKIKGVDYDWIQVQMYGRFFRQRHVMRKIITEHPKLEFVRKLASPFLK